VQSLAGQLARPRAWVGPAVLLGALLVWEWGVQAGFVSRLLFPAPSTIGKTLARLAADGSLLRHTSATLLRLFLGILLGGAPGLILGLLMGWSQRLRTVVEPLISAAHPIPKIAILPLIMTIFGIGEPSRLIVAALAAFFPILINTASGVRQIHPIHFQVARNYGASRWKIFTRVILPGSLPMVLTGLLLALNITLLLTIAVEMVMLRDGLGSTIWFAWETMRVEELYASLAVIILLGIGFNLLIRFLMAVYIPWQTDRDK
jgi:NitT/TauT family transport system permease protein